MRILLDADPFLHADDTRAWRERGHWPARWVGCKDASAPFIAAFRCQFELELPDTLRMHVSADERYDLYMDGVWISAGPERGAPECWFYETIELDLNPGPHCLVARVWAAAEHAAIAQMSVRPGFLCAAEGSLAPRISTGVGRWEAKLLGGYTWLAPGAAHWRGARIRLDAAQHPWGWQTGEGQGWQPTIDHGPAIGRRADWEFVPHHLLQPGMLPPQIAQLRGFGRVRHVDSAAPESLPVAIHAAQGLDTAEWRALADAEAAILLPPNTTRRVVFDLQNYYCGYPHIHIVGGAGAILRLHWAEALRSTPEPWAHDKGQRDMIEGKYVIGFGDTFVADGGERVLEPLWWNAGRYLELMVQTQNSPLTIRRLVLRETRYPLEDEGAFAAEDARLEMLVPLLVRGMQMCAHETFMDCPHYEELQYAGDARLELLIGYTMASEAHLALKALRMFDASRLPSGLTQSRYPSRGLQIIAPFGLWWAAMVCDYALWRNDLDAVRKLLPGVRSVLAAFERYTLSSGLLMAPDGWNFMDWVPEWSADAGAPPGAAAQPSAVLGWQLVYVQRMVADLEEALGEPELAARLRRIAALGAQALDAFWDASRGMYADDLGHQHYSEHTQCLALLSGALSSQRFAQVGENLLTAPDLARTTIYFSHYLFEAYRVLGRVDMLLRKLNLWHGLLAQGFCTPVESPEPSRSDCHAWGSHPLFHMRATILGVRPAALGFGLVEIAPQLGGLRWASGRVPHPGGEIVVALRRMENTLHAEVILPRGVTGVLRWGGRTLALHPGWARLEIALS